jgi:hypothetical protein
MADENKNKKSLYRRMDEALDGEMLSSKAAKKLKNPDDPDVRLLESKNRYIRRDGWYNGEACKDRSWYLYEPHARYKRIENPSYAPVKKSSLTLNLIGILLAASGFATGTPPLIYAGAALGLGSLGYFSGHSLRRYTTDERFEKVPWPEEKVQEKLKEAKAKDEGLYQSLKQWITDHTFQKEPWCEDRWKLQDKEPKDKGLYIRRTHKTNERRGGMDSGGLTGLDWRVLKEPEESNGIVYAKPTLRYLALGGVISAFGAACGFAPVVYAGAVPALYALGHYAGFIFGNKRAKPEYQKAGDLEKKVETMQNTYGRMTPTQPENGNLSKYEKELKK